MTAPIRIVVVDDQGVIRAGLRMILDHEADMLVVGEASDGLQAITMVRAVKPDVVLMDIRMPHLDGIEATRRLTVAGPVPAVLVLTTFDDDEYVLGAIRAGAAGFLLKDAGPDVLVSAVRTLHGGDSLVDPAVTRTLIARCLELEQRMSASARAPGNLGNSGNYGNSGSAGGSGGSLGAAVAGGAPFWDQRLATLSERERQIFLGMARGRSNRELASALVVSETTVKSHVSAVLAKLGLQSRVQAVVLAYEARVITPGEPAAGTGADLG